jgi:hypothetical protein
MGESWDISSLQLGAFNGFQTFIVDGVDFSSDLALLYFARTLRLIAHTLTAENPQNEFCDLDSIWRLSFRLLGDKIEISDNVNRENYQINPRLATISFEEFVNAVDEYSANLWRDCCELCPPLLEHEWIADWMFDPAFDEVAFQQEDPVLQEQMERMIAEQRAAAPLINNKVSVQTTHPKAGLVKGELVEDKLWFRMTAAQIKAEDEVQCAALYIMISGVAEKYIVDFQWKPDIQDSIEPVLRLQFCAMENVQYRTVRLCEMEQSKLDNGFFSVTYSFSEPEGAPIVRVGILVRGTKERAAAFTVTEFSINGLCPTEVFPWQTGCAPHPYLRL